MEKTTYKEFDTTPSVLIPERIAEFFPKAIAGFAGTRDKNLAPNVHRLCGWTCNPDRKSAAVYVSDAHKRHLSNSLNQNGQISVVLLSLPSHETYQLKGDLMEIRVPNTLDLSEYEKCLITFTNFASVMGYPEKAVQEVIGTPILTVQFSVRQIFYQTPGPGAGDKVEMEKAG